MVEESFTYIFPGTKVFFCHSSAPALVYATLGDPFILRPPIEIVTFSIGKELVMLMKDSLYTEFVRALPARLSAQMFSRCSRVLSSSLVCLSE